MIKSVITLDGVLASPNLPTLPGVAMNVLELTRDPDVELSDIAEVVQYDQALCGKILKTVNSAYFGLRQPCPTIARAVALLGLTSIKSLVLGFGLVDLTKRSGGGLDLIAHWRRGVYSAASARRIAIRVDRCDPDEAFVAALMQDVGMLALFSAARPAYQALIDAAGNDHRDLSRVEASELGFTHADVGAGLGETWHLPAQIIEPVRFHHADDTDHGAAHGTLIATVRASHRLALVLAFDGGEDELRAAVRLGEERLGLSFDDMASLLRQSAEDARSLSALLEVDAGGPSDIEDILARAQEARAAIVQDAHRATDELRTRKQRFGREVQTDSLTGLASRASFDEKLGQRFKDAIAGNGCLGLIFVDADHFEAINDAHGSQAGNTVLEELAQRMRAAVPEGSLVCRYGGEKFTVLLPGMDRSRTGAIAERIRLLVAAHPIDAGDHTISRPIAVTVSLGVAALHPADKARFPRPEKLLEAAERSVHAAKEAGRNCVRVFTPAATGARRSA